MAADGSKPTDTSKGRGDESGAQVGLHPLVIVNICDHYTRVKVQDVDKFGPQPRVYGLLWGTQSGLKISVHDSFELATERREDGGVKLDGSFREFVEKRSELFLKVFPQYELIGWYTTSTSVIPQDMEFHRFITERGNENPLFLMLDPIEAAKGMVHGAIGSSDLPVTAYQAAYVAAPTSSGTTSASLVFERLALQVEAVESERITLDAISDSSTERKPGDSALKGPYGSGMQALEQLGQRVELLERYVQSVREGSVPADRALLRAIQAVASRAPVDLPDDVAIAAQSGREDAQMATLLATVARGSAAMDGLVTELAPMAANRIKRSYEK